jgi:hypothetical protein
LIVEVPAQRESPSIVTRLVMPNIAWIILLMRRTLVFETLGCMHCKSAKIFIMGFL